ncbi:MAG: hypothetical protein HY216_06835 [Candidatus Rokubacteria bacterium]|nr:hypothetical protein [Candidatus Rokubacteria bacterium]
MALDLTYFEDVEVGDVLVTPAMTVTEAHVSLYRGVTGDTGPADPREVPELFPLCLSTGLGWRVSRAPLAVMAFMGFDWRIVAPLHVGDTVHSRATARIKRTMRDGGVVVEEHDIVNQAGEVVQQGAFTFLIAKRPKETVS